jgi:hypothetical protein
MAGRHRRRKTQWIRELMMRTPAINDEGVKSEAAGTEEGVLRKGMDGFPWRL